MSGIYQSKLVQQIIEDTPQDLTASWVDIGDEFVMEGYSHLGLWVNLDINDSLNARIRVLVKNSEAHADEYSLPIKTVGASSIAVEDLYYEFNVDADQKVLLEVETNGHVKIAQVQISAGTAGVAPGQILSLLATKVWR